MVDDREFSLSKCKLVRYQSFVDPRGNLGVVEEGAHLPFSPKRFYFIRDVPPEVERGWHAHKRLHQFIFALAGSVELGLDDGRETAEIQLRDDFEGFYMCPMIWRVLRNFSPGAVVGVLASDVYDESDYIRSYEAFREFAGT